MNYARIDTLMKLILPALVGYKNVDEVVVSHASKTAAASAGLFSHPKVTHRRTDYELDSQLGVATRFKAAELSSTKPWVIFLDDDLLPTEEALEQLIGEFKTNTHRIVGKWGRTLHARPFYDTVDCVGECSVVLTKLMIMRRSDVKRFFVYADWMGLHSGIPGLKPTWNGEDIFMSLINSHCRQFKHTAMIDLNVTNVKFGGDESISGDIPRDWTAVIPTSHTLPALVHWWTRGILWNMLSMWLARIRCPSDLLQFAKVPHIGNATVS